MRIIKMRTYCGFNYYGSNPVYFAFFYSILIGITFATIMGDECDWTGSGLSSTHSDKGVTPVYLRCSAGRIKWMYPRGALRILLRLPNSQTKNFHACVKIRSTKSKPGHPPITRIYLEGTRSLIPLLFDANYNEGIVNSNKNSKKRPMRCFNSRNGQAAIYIEATDERSFEKQLTEIEYDLQPLPNSVYGQDPHEECRPCSMEEMAHIYCTSDLVTRGTIHSVDNDDNLELSLITVKITKLVRQTYSVDEFFQEVHSSNSVSSSSSSQNDPEKSVILNIPQHCGISHGIGEFVFMARRKLGDLRILCAPRLETWILAVNKLNEEGRSHCVLKS